MNPNLDLLIQAAARLEPLLDQLVFLGGCATGLLITDPAAPDIRSTVDVDVIVEVSSLPDYHAFSQQLCELGFREDNSEGAPICRWVAEQIILDVMPTDSRILGFSNRWYQLALQNAIETIIDGYKIRTVTAPFFLGTKLEAFYGRGNGDYLGSHDLEDMISVIDGRPTIIQEIRASDEELRTYLANEFSRLTSIEGFMDALPGHLPGGLPSQARLPGLKARIREIAQVG